MTLSSNQLDAFYMVAQQLSFSKAADKLFVTQSALSQRVMNLEQELGVTLFIRDRSNLRLTEEALSLLRYCQTKNVLEAEILNQIKASNSQSRHIRIGGFSSITRSLIVPALSKLSRENHSLKLNVMTREVRELPELLKRSEVDYIVIDTKIDREDMKTLLLGYEENVLVTSKKYKTPEIYLDHDEEDEVTKRYLKLAGKKTTKLERLYLDDVYGILDGVKHGLGKAILPKHLILEHKDIVILHPTIILKIPVILHYYDQPYYSKIHQAVIDSLTEYAKENLKTHS